MRTRCSWRNACNGLHSHTLAIEIADDSTVGCIESNVGQRTQFMSIVGARLPCGKRYYVHTLSQDSLGRNRIGQILVSDGGGLAVTTLSLRLSLKEVKAFSLLSRATK